MEYIRSKNSDLILEKFYITNNISESLHKKINSYLPKTSTTPEMFFKAMKKLFLDNCIKKGNTNRFDIKTQAILKIIEDFELNQESKGLLLIYLKI